MVRSVFRGLIYIKYIVNNVFRINKPSNIQLWTQHYFAKWKSSGQAQNMCNNFSLKKKVHNIRTRIKYSLHRCLLKRKTSTLADKHNQFSVLFTGLYSWGWSCWTGCAPAKENQQRTPMRHTELRGSGILHSKQQHVQIFLPREGAAKTGDGKLRCSATR